jgi:hypothetical protein
MTNLAAQGIERLVAAQRAALTEAARG